jgi:hypothetical protein
MSPRHGEGRGGIQGAGREADGSQAMTGLIRSTARGFEQASRVTLPKSCRRNNSCGDALPDHVRLASVLQFFKGSVQNLTHLRNCLGSERPT